jgi:tetratricopeptide (TPR) repeat protein
VDSVETAEAESSLARILMLYGENDRAKRLLEHAMEVQRSHGSSARPAAETTLGLGNAQRSAGDPDAARRALEEGLSRYRQAYGEIHPRVASHLVNLGWLSADQGDFEASAAYCREALVINRKLFDQPPVSVAENYGCVSHAERNLGHLDDALAAAQEAVRIVRAAGAEETPHLPPQLVLEALVYREMGLHGEVARLNREIAEAYRAAGPVFRMDYANTLVWVADEKFKAGQAEQAGETYRKAIDELAALVGDDSPRLVYPLANLAFVDVLAGAAPVALADVDRALEIAGDADDLDPPWTLKMLELRKGEVLASLGRTDGACELTANALAALAKTPGEASEDHARAQSAHGYCLALAGEPPQEAFSLMERGLATLRARHHVTHIHRVQALERLAAASRAVDDPAREDRWAGALEEERSVMRRSLADGRRLAGDAATGRVLPVKESPEPVEGHRP